MKYNTDREFKQAIAKAMGADIISVTAWVLIKDFLATQGIHPACDDEDIKEGIAKLNKFKNILEESNESKRE